MDILKRFINVHVPLTNCTLRCHYCYVTINQTFGKPIPKLSKSAEFIRKALNVKRLGGCCHLNFCADGETLLLPELIEVIKQLLIEGHYVSIVSNCTLKKRIDELIALPTELRKHLFVKASYHYLELKRLNILDVFFDNTSKLHNAGISITIEITPNDELIPEIEDAVALCYKRMGAAPHFTIARDQHYSHLPILTAMTRNEYRQVWGKYKSVMFEFKEKIFGRPIKKFCYGGEWFLCLNLMTGNLSQCHGTKPIQNIYENIDAPINYKAIGICPKAHCYNGHALLTQGVVPGVKSPTYAETRDRVMPDGRHWLYPEILSFFSQRLYDNNKVHSWYKRVFLRIKDKWHYIKSHF